MLKYRKKVFTKCFGRDTDVAITEVNGGLVIRVRNSDGGLTHARPIEIYKLLIANDYNLSLSIMLETTLPRAPGCPYRYWGQLRNYLSFARNNSTPLGGYLYRPGDLFRTFKKTEME